MSPKASSNDRACRERGATIVFVALALTALLSVVALAVDVGMLLTAKTEAQRTADAAAMAGAGTLLFSPDDDGPARSEAESSAATTATTRSTTASTSTMPISPATDRAGGIRASLATTGWATSTTSAVRSC